MVLSFSPRLVGLVITVIGVKMHKRKLLLLSFPLFYLVSIQHSRPELEGPILTPRQPELDTLDDINHYIWLKFGVLLHFLLTE